MIICWRLSYAPVESIASSIRRHLCRKPEIRGVGRMNAIERFTLLDRVADLLEKIDACALVGGCPRDAGEACDTIAIDATHNSIRRRQYVVGQRT